MQLLYEEAAERQLAPAQFTQVRCGLYRERIGDTELQGLRGGQSQCHNFFQIERRMAKERDAFANVTRFEEFQQGLL